MPRMLLSLLLIVVACSMVLAQPTPATPPVTISPQSAGPATDPTPGGDVVIKDVNLPGMPLNEFIDFLRDASGGKLNIVLLNPPGTALPVVPGVKVKNIRIGQLLELVTRMNDSTEIRRADGPAEMYFVRYLGVGDALSPIVWRQFSIARAVRARIDEIRGTGANIGSPELEKKAHDQVLTLIDRTLKLLGGDAPVLQLHEETDVLLFKGTPRQAEIVQGTLDTLVPKDEPQTIKQAEAELRTKFAETLAKQKTEWDLKLMELRDRLSIESADFRRQLETERQKTMQLTAENERLKVRLEAKDKPAGTKE